MKKYPVSNDGEIPNSVIRVKVKPVHGFEVWRENVARMSSKMTTSFVTAKGKS